MMSDAARLISPEKRGEDLDTALRPQSLDEFTGQAEARATRWGRVALWIIALALVWIGWQIG